MTNAKATTAVPPFTEGQRVWVYSQNPRLLPEHPMPATVTKVGRKLVTTRDDDQHGPERTFRIEGGAANDQYGHEWVKTDQQKADDERRGVLNAELAACGLEMRTGYRLPLDALEAVAAALRDTLGEPAQVRA